MAGKVTGSLARSIAGVGVALGVAVGLGVIAVPGLGLGIAAAVAQPRPRYPRPTPPPPVTVTLSARTRPRAPTAAAAAPTVTPDDILAGQREAAPMRQKQIDLLLRLIAATPDSDPDKADLYLRVAEAHAQRERFHRLEANRAAIAADAATSAADRRRLTAAAADHRRQEVDARTAAIEAYRALTDGPAFAGFADLDAALFYVGYALQHAGRGDEARVAYRRLLTEHPASRFVPEAYLAFADHAFETGDLASAGAFYRKVRSLPSSKVHAYAGYMLGWVELNLLRPEDAGRQFLEVIRETAGDPAQATLARASKKDFVRAFAEFGLVQKAWPMFESIDAGGAAPMVEQLADLYVEQGKPDRAVYAYRALIAARPGDAHVCRWQHDVAQALLSSPRATMVDKVDEVVRLARLYQTLAGSGALPAADARDCHDDAAAMTCELARAYHSELARSHHRDLLAQTERLYATCLATFADADANGETGYFHAELLWTLADGEADARRVAERWERAAVAFTAVVRAGLVDAGRRKEAAYAAVLGWKNALAVAPRPTAPPLTLSADRAAAAAAPAPRPIPAREQQLLGALADYRRFVTDPDDDERIGMSFLEGELYRTHGHVDEAAPLFEDIVTHHPGHETALYAANLLLDVHIVAGRDDLLARWATWFHDHPDFVTARPGQDRGALAARVAEILIITRRRAAQRDEELARRTGDLAAFVRCGNGYLALFNDTVAANPAAGVAEKMDEVLYDAGVCYEDGRSLSAAIAAYQELRDRFPASPVAARALARLGAVYARVAYYREASTMFEQYARAYAGQRDAYQAMNDAVIYRKGIGDDAQAIADTTFFIRRFGDAQPADAARAFFSLGAIYEKRGELDQVVRHYRAYLKRYGERGGADKVVVAYARIGQILWDRSCPGRTVDGSCIEVSRARAALARTASLRAAADPARARCGADTKLKVTPVDRDRRAVAAAMAAFAEAVRAYDRAGGQFPGGDEAQARRAYASARFHQAEVDYEAYLRVRFPAGLDFDPAKPAARQRSDARLRAWIADKQRLGTRTTAAYGALVHDVAEPTHAIAAAARIGQVSQNFSDALYTAEIPAFIRPYPEAVDAYCDALTRVAEPYEAASLDGFGACLDASTRLGWFSSWSRLCERELGQIEPGRFPTASELRAAPDALATLSDVERPIARLE